MSLLTKRCVKGAAILSLLTAGLLTACTSEPQNFNELSPEPAEAEHISQLSSWIYPDAEAESARRAFVERCVAEAGGTYREPVLEQSLASTVYTGRTTAELKEKGYGDLPAAEEGTHVAEFGQKGLDAYLGSADAEQFEVTFMDYTSGEIAADGCMAQSYEYIYGSAENGIRVALLAPQFGQAIAEDLQADQGYIDLQGAWASCMEDAGVGMVASTDQTVYHSHLVDDETAQKMLENDISCRENTNFDEKVAELKNSYYESVYKRLKQFSEEIEEIHSLAAQKVEADKTDPKNTSPVTVPTGSAAPKDSESEPAETASPEAS